jgi:Cof subfamily protein (haloacid dehalogenase superfamily)
MIRLVGIDVDGTLVGTSGAVDPRVWNAAARASAAGIRLALCTGRPAFALALDYARHLDAGGWHAFQNGASIVNLGSGESHSVPLPAECVASFIAQARESRRTLELYSDTQYAVESTTTWAREHAEILGVPFEPRPFESLQEPIVRAQWLLTAKEVADVAAVTPPGVEVAVSTAPQMPETSFVGFTRRGVSKASAIRTIAAAYDISLADTMYIGDSGNDLPALAVVGHPIAMGNAAVAVRKAATHVVAGVDDAGVAEALALAVAS